MKKCALEYRGYKFDYLANLGDEIQTLAAERLLGHVDGYVSREHLHEVQEKCLVSMNGFFMGSSNWPPSECITPVFFAFHLNADYERVVCSTEGIAYLKKHEPIGCRDRGTVDILSKHGVQAYYSKCVTLTFPRRAQGPSEGKVFIVGVDRSVGRVIPRSIAKTAVRISQSLRLPLLSCETKRGLAQGLLSCYRDEASLVITSKIHCAMPCIAMGIPVVFLYPDEKKDDYRTHIVSDFVPINYVPTRPLARIIGLQRLAASRIDWDPAPVEFEEEKKAIAAGYQSALHAAVQRSGGESGPGN